MNAPDPQTPSLRAAIAHRFSLLDDKADDAEIDRGVRAGVELRGATPWILMLAILIASIGLNTNSTAVIIGAMLVSPLMGPIVGLGYGVGIFDFALVRRSLANLAIAAGISLLTSTLYFMLTPLDEAQSELLARTTPSLWDVLIALTGGLAGIIGQTRREKSNVIPGVAIATALMPPLCTAGYGLANANWAVFGGAFYLFAINCVFIAFAAVVVIEFLRLPHRKFVDPVRERHVKRALLAIVLLTGLPSIYLAVRLVDNEVFSSRARDFVRKEFRAAQVHVLETRVAPNSHEIEVTLIGRQLPPAAIKAIEGRLALAGLEHARLSVHQAQTEASITAILLLRRQGDYIFPGAPIGLMTVPVAGAALAIQAATALGTTRGGANNVEDAVRQLVEVAVRALSPGINDPHTAMSVLDRLGAALCELSGLQLRNGIWVRNDVVALELPSMSYQRLVDLMLHMIRQNAGRSPAILIRMLDVLTQVASTESDPDRHAILAEHAELICLDAEREIANPFDLKNILHRRTVLQSAIHQAALPKMPDHV
jgi:uncharacterized hydrophobic protein (TIGR00271 family)